VDQAAEPVTAAEPIQPKNLALDSFVGCSWLGERRPLTERAVRPVRVVVLDVDEQYAFEVAAPEDQQPVETFTADAPDPPLSMRPRLRRSHWRLDHSDSGGAEDLVEVAGELAVAITDHKPRLDPLVVDVHEQVARLLGHPCAVGIRRDPGEVHTTSRQLNEEQDVEPPQEDRVDGQEIALEDACCLLAKELCPTRLKSLGCRFDPCLAQDRPDSARRDLHPEPDQLTLNPPIPPTRVLPRKPNDKRTDFGRCRRATGTPMRIRPAARHQLSVPTQKRRRRHEERSPRTPRQHTAKRSQQRPINWTQLRARHLTLEHAQLLAQQQDLDLLFPLRSEPQRDELMEMPQRPVQKRQNRAPRTTRHRR
jgi:hypothetical protein